ncbi:hypothetical protein GY45DRAFT_1439236 [Cubamyces sp. BRFM 1775]|nr:hypothetical protein GY45DRAFT_1439236 [Cubamyces sp. BRFM 1775]
MSTNRRDSHRSIPPPSRPDNPSRGRVRVPIDTRPPSSSPLASRASIIMDPSDVSPTSESDDPRSLPRTESSGGGISSTNSIVSLRLPPQLEPSPDNSNPGPPRSRGSDCADDNLDDDLNMHTRSDLNDDVDPFSARVPQYGQPRGGSTAPSPPSSPEPPARDGSNTATVSLFQTPTRTGVGSPHGLKHNRPEVHTFLKEDLRTMSHRVPTHLWLQAVLDVDSDTLARFREVVNEEQWSEDTAIAEALQQIQSAKREALRKWSTEQASPAIRRPDIACARESDIRTEKSDSTIKKFTSWWLILTTLEVKLPKAKDRTNSGQYAEVHTEDASVEQPASPGTSSHTPTVPVGDVSSHVAPQSKKRTADTSRDGQGPAKKPRTTPAFDAIDRVAGLQALDGALEIVRNSNGARLSSLAITVKGTIATFYYIDPCGIITSDDGLCLVKNLADFVAVVVALERLDASGWGMFPQLIPPQGKSADYLLFAGTLKGCAFKTPEGSSVDGMQHRVTFGESVYTQYALVGRRTTVYEAQADPPFKGQKPEERIVAKLSYQVHSRTAEHKLIEAAREKGVPHIPTVYGHHDLFDLESLQDGIRARVVKHCGVFNNYENRVARIIMTRMYTPLEERLHEYPMELIMMVDHISECLHHLRHDALILHRDVSVRNIMCEITEDGPNFIFGDFDLAVTLNPDGTPQDPTGKRHTGTLPFMAIELLEDMASKPGPNSAPVVHELHHDYESLYWVTLWCSMKVDYYDQDAEDQKRIDAFVNQWEYAVGGSKTASDFSRGSSAWSNSSRGSRARAGAGLGSQNQQETSSTGSEARLNLQEIGKTKSTLLLTGVINKEHPPTTEQFEEPAIQQLIAGFCRLIVIGNAYQQRRPKTVPKSRTTNHSWAKGNFWTLPQDAHVDKPSTGTPMRDLVTREAIQKVVLTAKMVALS